MSVQDVLGRLDHVKPGPDKGKWTARCPVHEDRNNSLSIGKGDDGQVLVKCFACGANWEQIADALDLPHAAFFADVSWMGGRGGGLYPSDAGATLQPPPAKPQDNGTSGLHDAEQPTATAQPPEDEPPPKRADCGLKEYAAYKRLSPAFLKGLGLSEFTWNDGAKVISIPYFAENAQTLLCTRYRLALKKPTEGPDNRLRSKKGDKVHLYGQWRLPKARKAGYIVLVEGESDCHTLWFRDIHVLGIPGAGNWREERDAHLLDGIPVIYVVIEPDTGGEAVRKWLSKSSIRDRVRLVQLGEHKDPSGLYLSDPEHFKERWQAACEAAQPWTDIEARDRAEQARSAREGCADLAEQKDILEAFAQAIARMGVAGEHSVVKLLYLAATSRLLDRPLSVTVKGASSAGKSYTTEKVLSFFPESAYYALSAMSERALAYSEEPLAHRMLVIYGAAGLSSDFATYLLRSLLSEGRVRYETVEKTSEGMRPRLIEREGPTGLLITTTAVQLHPENETRMLSVSVNDGKDQTKAVILAQAQGSTTPVDLAPWHDVAGEFWLSKITPLVW
jgi:hypothetical protein